MKLRHWWWIAPLLLLLLPSACGTPFVYLCAPISGQVLDAETKMPIEGAVVVGQWKLYRGGLDGPMYRGFLAIKETTTDKDGRYHFNGFIGFNPEVYELRDDPLLIVFKGGYQAERIMKKYPDNTNRYYLGIYRNPNWNGDSISLKRLDTHDQDFFSHSAKGFYLTLQVDLYDLTLNATNCEWTKIPRMILAMDVEKARLRSLYSDAVIGGVGINDLPNFPGCPSPSQFFASHVK